MVLDIGIKSTTKLSKHFVCLCKFVKMDVCVESFVVNLIPNLASTKMDKTYIIMIRKTTKMDKTYHYDQKNRTDRNVDSLNPGV